jgi:hypothetical protein
MSLYYEGTKITNNMKLRDLHAVVENNMKIIQDKLSLDEVSGIIADVHE